MKAIQVLLQPTATQIKLLDAHLEEHRTLYNRCLALKKDLYTIYKLNVTSFDLIVSEISEVRKIANCSAMQQTVRRLGKAFERFFDGIKEGRKVGFPRFKNKDKFKTIEYGKYGDGGRLKGDYLYLQNVGLVKCKLFCEIGKIRTFSITKKADNFYVNFIVNDDSVDSSTADLNQSKAVGIDVGLKTFITTSDGEKFDSPKYHKQSLKEEAKIHRRIHKAQKGTSLRAKHKKSLSKIKRKIANRRKDFNHKLSRKLVDKYDVLVLEDIDLNELKTDNSNINRTYADVAIGQFRNFLIYKAENAGKKVIKVDPRNTTKECSECGSLVEKTLKDRVHNCSCGHVECRDINAAKVILRRGLASLV